MKLLVLLAIVLSINAYGQFDKESDVINFISGDYYKLWFFDRYETNMGGNEECISGKSFTFHNNKKIEIKECINSKWKTEEYTFKLRKETAYDWWVTFNDETYYLVMNKHAEYLELKLRTEQSLHEKVDESHDIILKHYIDD